MSVTRDLPAGFEQRAIQCNGARPHVTVGGVGDPVVLLHGWPETAGMWQPALAQLAEQGRRIIAPDLRGRGESEAAVDGYGQDDQAEDQLEATAPVRLVGHDIGGMVASSFARLHPNRVARLALLDLALPGLGLEQAMDVANGGLWPFGLFMHPDIPAMLIAGHEDEFFRWLWTSWASVPGKPSAKLAAAASENAPRGRRVKAISRRRGRSRHNRRDRGTRTSGRRDCRTAR